MNIKYLSDGKKVTVINQINEKEFIVQEIMVSKGKEFPSGKNFVASNLLDDPVETWYEKRKKEVEQEYNKVKESINKETKQLRENYNKERNILRQKASYFKKFCGNFDSKIFQDIVDYMTGKIKYIVCDSYSPRIIKFEDFDELEDFDHKDLRLISFFGKDNGTFTYGRYSDYSGGIGKRFWPYKTLKEAKDKLKELIESNKEYHDGHIEEAEKYSIKLDSTKLRKYYSKKLENARESLGQTEEEYLKGSSKLRKDISTYQEKLNKP